MCGLFGWQWMRNPGKNKRVTLASALASDMVWRGKHSWGWYSPDDGGKHERGLGSMATVSIVKAVAKADTVIAHTRHATQGSVTVDNCHPFMLDRLVGAHNGIVSNHGQLNRVFKRDCAVDSQHIFKHLEDQEPLHSIEAYGAISYQWHHKPDEVLLGRFNGGELAIGKTRHGIIWASTEDAVVQACWGANIQCTLYEIEQGVVYAVRNGKLWREVMPLEIAKPTWSCDWRNGGSSADLDAMESIPAEEWEYDEVSGEWGPPRKGSASKHLDQDQIDEEERQWLIDHGYMDDEYRDNLYRDSTDN